MSRVPFKRIRRWIVSGSLCLGSIGTIAFGWRNWVPQQSTGKLQYVAANPDSDISAFLRSIRPVYPYSVIPGGVYSPRELRNSVTHDAVIASHYAGFDIAHARLLRTTASMLRYVSYRKSDQVVWTRRPLRIPKGELLLSDGFSFARARCGNRLSSTPIGSAREDGPDVQLSIPDIEAPHSNSPIAPLDGPRISEPGLASLGPTPRDILFPLEPGAESSDTNQSVPTPILTVPMLVVPRTAPPPLIPFFPIAAPSEPPISAPVPEPSTRWQVGLTLGIALLLIFSFRRASENVE